jgi:hypothetical protein
MNEAAAGRSGLSPEGPKSPEICGDEPFGSVGESKLKKFFGAGR